MIMQGELEKDKIIVKRAKDVGRLYNKNNLGKMLPNNCLQLNLVEGVFLLDEKKMRIFQNKKEIFFENLVKKAAKKIPGFEVRYLVFKDLRKRGYPVREYKQKKEIAFHYDSLNESQDSIFVSIFSERSLFDIKNIIRTSNHALKNNRSLWIAILDEEGDITYYRLSREKLSGEVKGHKFSSGDAVLLENRIIIFDKKLSKKLHDKEFFGKFFGEGLQLSLVEGLYLLEKNIIDVYSLEGDLVSFNDLKSIVNEIQPDIENRLFVFKNLKKQGLIVKTGFKFGSHFRVYTRDPDEIHAEYLVNVVDSFFKSYWSEISRAVRLAHSVNKEIVFTVVKDRGLEYVCLGRLRP